MSMGRSWMGAWALCLVAAATSVAAVYHGRIVPDYKGFIRVQGGQFVDDACSLFPVTGLNAWDMMECGAGFTYDADTNLTGPEAVRFTMQAAASNGLTLVRAFGHGHDAFKSIILQPRPGLYNETAFRGLDFVLDQASQYGVKVMFTLTNNWKTFDSKYNYVKWANKTDLDDFWTDPKVKRLYKNHIYAMTSRTNVYNGRRYRDDPTIFGWDLINEPRCNCFPKKLPPIAEWDDMDGPCSPKCADKITAWTHEMAAYLKEKDPNHLVTVGLEGFWASHAEEAAESNPLPGENGSLSWTALTGQNFTAQHDSPHIDFCGAHYWPDLWTGMENQAFLTKWIKSHADACKKIGKPFVLEEFGKNVTAETDAAAPKDWKKVRGPMFARAYSEYINSLENGGNYQGTLFWKWGLSPKNPRTDYLEVAVPDPTFTDIVVPGAKAALDWAKKASPLKDCKKITRDSSPVLINAWDRTLADWLKRGEQATKEYDGVRRNEIDMENGLYRYRVLSVFGSKYALSDDEVVQPADDMGAQVNETELFPALMHTFEDPDAENGDAMESLFDHPQGESQADASMKQDVQEAAKETSGDGESAAMPDTPQSSGGVDDLGSRSGYGSDESIPVHHRLAKSVNSSGGSADSAAAGASPAEQQGGR